MPNVNKTEGMDPGTIYNVPPFGDLQILECRTSKDVSIKFLETGTVITGLGAADIRKGAVSDPYYPFLVGKGYRGIGSYRVNQHKLLYVRWTHMFRRIYSSNQPYNIRNYSNCSVDKRWYNFQNYAEWYYNQPKHPTETYDIDKDLKIKGNRVYGPDTCLLIPEVLNAFISIENRPNKTGSGVNFRNNKYRVRITRNGVRQEIGAYEKLEDAIQSYRTVYREQVVVLANRLWAENKITSEIFDIVKDRYSK